MDYWFDGRKLRLNQGEMGMFWGMIPHQVTDCAEGTEFIVLYVPMSAFLELPDLNSLRQLIFSGALLDARGFRPSDFEVFARWRQDLLSGDEILEPLVRDELTARLRRLDRDGWRDLRGASPLNGKTVHHDSSHGRAHKVEQMSRFIGEHALDDITIGAVAQHAGLHPNYAMALFQRTMGLTIKQSIMRHRLDAARSMLMATDKPVSSVAFDCGFGSLSSFYVAFERRFSSSPSVYRRAIIGGLGQKPDAAASRPAGSLPMN
jgi:AraC-like DNA-binding protein